jgi:hypothetical protein
MYEVLPSPRFQVPSPKSLDDGTKSRGEAPCSTSFGLIKVLTAGSALSLWPLALRDGASLFSELQWFQSGMSLDGMTAPSSSVV